MYPFSNHSLSPACRHHLHRCDQLVIFKRLDSLLEVLTPLDNAIEFTCFEDIGKELVHQFSHTMAFIHHENCVPLTIVEYRERYYTVCIDSVDLLIACEISLDFDNVTQSHLQCSTQLRLPGVEYNRISNFVYVKSGFFLFVADNIVYNYYPERFSIGVISSSSEPLPHFPENVHLVYDRMETLLIYYRTSEGVDIVVPFDLVEERWIEYFPDTNLEYPCHNGFSIFVFPSISVVLFEVSPPSMDDPPKKFNISGSNFFTGLCFGNNSHSYFVYVDQLKGISILDIASGTNNILSNSTCSRDECQTPILYEGRYLMLREDRELVVRDIEMEYAPVISVSDDNDGLSIFFTGCPYEEMEMNITVPGENNNQATLAGSIVGVIFLLIVMFGIVVLSVYFWFTYRYV